MLAENEDMMSMFCRKSLFAAALASAFGAAALHAAAEPAPAVWEHVQTDKTFHVSDTYGADPLSYVVHWDSFALEITSDDHATTISGTSYLCQSCEAGAARPVMFLFNGGPGASSSPLHFALGPRSRPEKGVGADGLFPENPDTLLRAADLVFIDPVETGFSRASDPDGKSPYLSIDGDAEAVSTYIHAWLAEHDRENAPVFITGQSYGGFRLANMMPLMGDVKVAGLVLVSPMLDASGSESDLGYVFALPTMAATAWRLGKSHLEADSEGEAWNVAREFAETEYLVALQQGDLLSAQTAEDMAAKLAAMTGLAKQDILTSKLRIDTQMFLENVMADQGMLVSRLNTAIVRPLKKPENPDRPAAANDPSLGLGSSNKIIAEDIASYLEQATGLAGLDGYRSLNLDANFAWDWSSQNSGLFYTNGAPLLGDFLQDHDNVSLLVFGGYRDLATPLLATQYALSHAGLPEDRVDLIKMPTGHSPFDEVGGRARFSNRIYGFLTHASVPSSKDFEGKE